MALQTSLDLDNGLTLAGAYLKVSHYSGNRANCTITLEVFASKHARDTNKPAVEKRYIGLPLTLGATLEQMYTALKALPAFTSATDI